MDPFLTGPVSPTALLQAKALEPLSLGALETLRTIQSRDVAGYNEAVVRAEIIDPLLGVLGYEKGTSFSMDRERRVGVLGTYKALDYSMTLWSENFWLIEAKSAGRRRVGFKAADIDQAVGYAVHPEINAALVVLCDGRQVAVFDREHSQTDAMLTVDVRDLEARIDELRAVLSPWQVWFFEKRRVLRQLDKVFGKEFNLERVEEFKVLVTELLDSKRQSVLQNMRAIMNDPEREDENDQGDPIERPCRPHRGLVHDASDHFRCAYGRRDSRRSLQPEFLFRDLPDVPRQTPEPERPLLHARTGLPHSTAQRRHVGAMATPMARRWQ